MDFLKGNKFLIAFLIIGTIIEWLIVDLWVGPNGGPTESSVVGYWGTHLTFWSFTIGSLIGHWFFERKVVVYTRWIYPFIVIGALLLWDIYFIHTHGWGVEGSYRSPWIWFPIGMVMGMFFWPQRDENSIIP